jgi:hypothetical protein
MGIVIFKTFDFIVVQLENQTFNFSALLGGRGGEWGATPPTSPVF